jgi:hypothetical protein
LIDIRYMHRNTFVYGVNATKETCGTIPKARSGISTTVDKPNLTIFFVLDIYYFMCWICDMVPINWDPKIIS